MVTSLVAVVLLGVVDFVTGDYSVLIFYAIPVALVGWCVGRGGAVLISLASGLARWLSDYMSYTSYGTPMRYWNSLQDMIFLVMVGLLIALVRTLMIDEQNRPDD
jgi:hypothetical protein